MGPGSLLPERSRLWAAASHAVVLAALWWALTGDAAGGWLVGVPVVILATLASQALWTRRTGWLSPLALLRFGVYFLRESLRGGLDVARRAFAPSLPLRPALVTLRTRIPPGPAEVFLVNVLSLLPGTLSVDLRGAVLTLHVLDEDAPVEAATRALEGHVAAIFRLPLEATGQPA
jgi:multicomponent Na+:H+ antiporter subunit E